MHILQITVQETKQKPKILTEVSNMMAMKYHKNAYRHDDYYNNLSSEYQV